MSAIAQETRSYLPFLEHVLPLYTRARIGVLEACHHAVRTGADLERTIEGKSAAWVQRAFEESLAAAELADSWGTMSSEQLQELELADLDDFSLATLARLVLERDGVGPRYDELLRACLLSDRGSLLVDYDWMFADMTEYGSMKDEQEHLRLMELALAHNLRHSGGGQAVSIMTELAGDLLRLGQEQRAIDMYARLLRYDPLSFDIRESLAYALANSGFRHLALETSRNASALAARTGCLRPEADDLAMAMRCGGSASGDRDAEGEAFKAQLLEALGWAWEERDELRLDELARRLVPGVDDVPVKAIPLSTASLTGPIPAIVQPGSSAVAQAEPGLLN